MAVNPALKVFESFKKNENTLCYLQNIELQLFNRLIISNG